MLREGLIDIVSFEQRPEGNWGEAMKISGRKSLQAERKASAKALRQACVHCVPK